MAVLGDLMVLTFSQRGGFLKHPTPGGVPVSTTSPGWRVMNLYTHIGHNQCTLPFSWKIWRIKFGSLAVRVETAKLKSTRLFSHTTCNDAMHAAALLAVPGAPQRELYIQLAPARCKFAKSWLCSSISSNRMTMFPDTRACNVHDDEIRCKAPQTNVNSLF